MIKNLIRGLAATTALGLTCTAPAFAQSSTGSPTATRTPTNDNPADIIVTARRVEERLQDVPVSITVVSQQQITNRNIVNAADLAIYTPSLSANTNFGGVNTTFAIRGFGQESGTQPSVGLYFADVVAPRGAANNLPIGDGAGPGSLFDLQNVQVLKGPQGTLFGLNTTGGAILLVPQKPTGKFEGYVEGSYGNYDLKRIQAVLNVPLSDVARFRIGVDHEDRDGYLKVDETTGPSRFEDVGYTAVRASLVVDLTPDLENYTIASYLRSDTTGHIQKIVACNPTQSAANFFGLLACNQLAREADKGFYSVRNPQPSPNTLLTQWQIINNTTWKASDALTIKNIISYAQLKEQLKTALNGTDLELGDFGFPAGTRLGFVEINPLPGHATADQYTMTEEFRLQGEALDGKLNWQTGAYLEVSQPLETTGSYSAILLQCTDSAKALCVNPLGAGSINDTENRTSYHDVGLYAQATYKVTDKLSATGGFRYTWDRVKSDAVLKTLAVPTPGTTALEFCNEPTAPVPSCAETYKQKSKAPTWLADIDYKPSDNLLLYAKYSRGYRAGGVAPQAPLAFSTFKQEKVDAYEAGLKLSFLGALRGTFNVAGFYNNFTNQQLLLSLNAKPGFAVSPASAVLNAGKSRIFGAEVESSLTPFTGFTVNLSYAYLNTKVQEVTEIVPPANIPYIVGSSVLVGDPLPLTPKNQFTVTGTYTLPLDESFGRISLSATFTHSDRQLSNYIDKDPANAFLAVDPSLAKLSFLARRNLLNLNMNWNNVAGMPVDFGLFATNVTQKKYYAYVPGLLPSIGFEAATIGEPRMFGGRLRYHFGS
jgi:iron complex outermembrane receptor protein